jgi:terminase, large subunit
VNRFKVVPLRPALDLPEDVRRLFLFKEIERPSVWAEKRFTLGIGYGESGPLSFKGREWQRDIVDAYTRYKTVVVCGPVQVGKSIAGIDIPWAWWNDMVGGRSLIILVDKDTSEDVFDERIKPAIKTSLAHLWSGADDDLTREKITLLNGIARCGSANVENDFATFPADLVLLDEVSKYESTTGVKGFDAISAARGRQKSYKGTPGYHGILSIVSSPKRHGDPLYCEIHKGGVLVLRFNMPCPRCGKYHELVDENIKELANDKGEMDHDPVRIARDNACVYECPHCKGIITDQDRWKMIKAGKWLADKEEIGADGEVVNPSYLREKTDEVCYWFNRLVSMPDKWTFADCLSAFFAARQAMDPKVWETYQNEDMARFTNPKADKISYSFLLAKCMDYYQYSELARVPDGVVIMFAGVDTQDDGFYYVVRGFGRGMESWLIRHDFIKCDMKDSAMQDPAKVLETFRRGLFEPKYVKANGQSMPIYAGFIDEGGHRQKDVQFIVKHLQGWKAYKGASSPTAELIRPSHNNDLLFLGHTRMLSEQFQRFIDAPNWHYPKDIGRPYLEQVVRQYWQEEKARNGDVKYKWVSGGQDHYRDCENYIMGLLAFNNIQERLNEDARIEALAAAVQKKAEPSDALPPPRPQEVKRRTMDPTAYRESLRQGRNLI